MNLNYLILTRKLCIACIIYQPDILLSDSSINTLTLQFTTETAPLQVRDEVQLTYAIKTPTRGTSCVSQIMNLGHHLGPTVYHGRERGLRSKRSLVPLLLGREGKH